jgi:hypothetical protein
MCSVNQSIQADGGSYNIHWTPDPVDTVISIILVSGTSPISTLDINIPNSGSHISFLPRDLTTGRYTLAFEGGQSGTIPNYFTSSGEFIITGDSAYNSSITPDTVASSVRSFASSVASQINSLVISDSASPKSSATSASSGSRSSGSSRSPGISSGWFSSSAVSGSTNLRVSGSSGVTSSTAGAAGATSGGSATTGALPTSNVSASASAIGTNDGESQVRHADFAVIIFAFVWMLMKI